MRFVASADWQLGMTASFLAEEARSRYRQARLETVRRIGRLADERNCDFVLVCGDVFESNQLDRQVVARAFEALADISVPVYLLPGNHDPLDASSIYSSAAFVRGCPDHVHVLTDSSPVEVLPGIEIAGAPWTSKRPLEDLVSRACSPLRSDGTIRVVAGHGAVDVLNPDREDVAAISLADLGQVLEDGAAQVAVLGDRHSTTRVEDRIWYPGTPEVTDRDEVDPGNVLVIELEPGDSSPVVEPVHVGEWTFLDHAHELTGRADVDALDDWLRTLPAKERTAVWLRLSGTLTVQERSELDAVLERHELVFAGLSLWQRHMDLSVLPSDTDFADLGLTGFAREAVDELVVAASSEEAGAGTAQDALGLLYRLTRGGR